MGGTTIATSETKIEALKLQSSAYGVPIAVVGGTNRVPGNLIWYGDFKAIPHTTTQAQGGKGGGVKTQNTTYSYSASVLMGVAQGPIYGVSRIWKGKELIDGGWTSSQIANANDAWTVPGSGAMTYTLSHAGTLIGDVTIVRPGTTRYSPRVQLANGTDYKISGGVVSILDAKWRGAALQLGYQYGLGSPDISALDELGISLVTGSLPASAPAWLAAAHPEQSLAYPTLAYAHAQDYDLGSGAQVDNHSFEVMGPGAYRYGTPDCNPAEFACDVLTNSRYGARMPADTIDAGDWVTYCRAAGLLMSPALTAQQRAGDLLQTLADHTNTAIVWSVKSLRMVPYADTAVSGNGVTYTPNTTPVYDLSDDCCLADAGEDPIKPERKAPASAYNHFKVEFNDRANYYNTSIVEAVDDADIAVNGRRTAATISAPWICEADVARLVAQVMLQRSLGVVNTYTVRLPWAYCLLEPMDLVTLSDDQLGLDKTPVRVTRVEEDEEGSITLALEDWPLGAASPTKYAVQVAGGYKHNYRAAPGNVATPVFFEAPVDLATETGLEVYVAVKGVDEAVWGGCSVWVSLDGTTYRKMSTSYGASRYGALSAAAAAGASTIAVDGLGTSQLINGSSSDAAALQTLCYIGGANPEYIAYTTATLTGAGAYTLGGLVHGAYGTDALAHANNDPFVRVDQAIGKSGAITLDYVGRTIYFKFTSFNQYQNAEQDLSTVSAYPYTITGAMVALPPGDVTGFLLQQNTFGLRASWTALVAGDIEAYEIRQGASWAAGLPIVGTTPTLVKGSSFSLPVLPAGVLTLWIKAVDRWGSYSRNATSVSLNIAGPMAPELDWTVNGTNEVLSWTVPGSGYTIDQYEVRIGSDWDTGTVLDATKATSLTRRVDYGGARRYWVAAVDGSGTYGVPGSIDALVVVPGPVLNTRADVVDNNALLYCSAPATGSLPIDHYSVRKGASWAGGTEVGSNGNSTFFAIFEQVGGDYTYWMAAVDTAGNEGTPVSLTVKINQPPDYVLRADINSDFSGTKTGMFLDNGGVMVGPFNTSETWATHFSSRSWTTIANQIAAGYPLYAMPSATSGTYDETIDYGSTLPATTITVTPTSTVVAGTVTTTCQIYTKLNVGDAWTALSSGVSALASNFRYVRVVLTFAATAGANLIRVDKVNIKLSTKLKTDSGKGTVTNATAGLAVSFNLSFLDADTPIVQPAGTTPLIPVVDFSDVPNPTGFTVYLYTTAGVKTTGDFSWTARGY